MIVPQTFATSFARTLDLFRDPAAKEDQKTQFRALVDQLKFGGATLKIDGGRVTVNGTPLDGAAYRALAQRLEFHAVGEIQIPAAPPPAEVFELLRALADQPGEDDIPTRLRATGAQRISVASVPHQVPVSPAPPAPPPAPAAPSPSAPPAEDPEMLREESTPVFEPATAATRSSTDILAELQRKPMGPQVGDLLAVLSRQLETAMRANRLEQALAIVAGIVRAEQSIGDEARRRQYSIALKRMYTKPLLEGIAHLVPMPTQRDSALLALQRAGEAGVEVLLDLLVAAPTIDERRGIFQALTGMKEGTDQLVHMLGHHQWFVVRNVAELVGELGLEEAVPALARQLDHEDERVRKAVALALAKTGSRSAAEPLRRALKDKSPEVRIQAALGVGGRKATALRVTAVEALRLAATPAAIGTLEGLSADGDKQVRAAAQDALKDLKHK